MVEGHRHERAVDVREHLVLVVRPLREAREELVHALAKGVVDMRAVLVDEDAVLVHVVVRVACDVVAALEDRDAEAGALGHAAGAHGTGVARSDDDHVVLFGVERCG